MSEAERLERLWSGEFGDEYTERNATAAERRARFWDGFLGRHPVERVLEIGCNLGGNLSHIRAELVCGIDVNRHALAILRENAPHAYGMPAQAREIPFRDAWFDLTFTVGVLIHQPDESLMAVMSEIVRCSRRWVLAVEYFAPEPTVVPYRNQQDALIKRDYGRLYAESFPELRLIDEGHLDKQDGFDDSTWWLFEKTGT